MSAGCFCTREFLCDKERIWLPLVWRLYCPSVESTQCLLLSPHNQCPVLPLRVAPTSLLVICASGRYTLAMDRCHFRSKLISMTLIDFGNDFSRKQLLYQKWRWWFPCCQNCWYSFCLSLSLSSLSVHVCLCASVGKYLWVHVHTDAHAHACALISVVTRDHCWGFSLVALLLIFWGGISYWIWSSLIWLSCWQWTLGTLVTLSPGLQTWTAVPGFFFLMWVSRIWHQVLFFPWLEFYWAISSAPGLF